MAASWAPTPVRSQTISSSPSRPVQVPERTWPSSPWISWEERTPAATAWWVSPRARHWTRESTTTFPEICGRICPQDRLCEGNCVIEQSGHGTVTIGAVEKYITDTAWDEGWVTPAAPDQERGESVGIIGAGPGGLAAADQLNRAGYEVVVYENHARPGGILRYSYCDPAFIIGCPMNDARPISDWAAIRLDASGVLDTGFADSAPDLDIQQVVTKRHWQRGYVLRFGCGMQNTIGRRRDGHVPAFTGQRPWQIAHDIAYTADFSARQGTVLRCEEYDVPRNDAAR